MDSQRQQASERIKQANNILVTVSSNPSVDQLAACIGLTVSLNKMGKHATAVFSGEVPSTLEFLQPEKTIEKNTDSLRDFIIALDKSKADKLRYKVEDRVVKIFITPYRTSISDKDLEFSQGDFNVDVVVALGVHNQEELDLAITSHGRILHDATIITLNTKPGGELGSINWLDPNASSLSELGVQLINALDKSLIDGQVATAFLTGIVAETERFSNGKTTPQTMSVSAQLMSSGANQQLVATKLQEPVAPPPQPAAPIATQEAHQEATPPQPVKKSNDGTLEIAHDETKTASEEEAEEDTTAPKEPAAEQQPEEQEPKLEKELEEQQLPPPPQIHIDEHGSLSPLGENPVDADEALLPPVVKHEEPEISHHNEPPKMILEPPTLGGALTANSNPGAYHEENEDAGLPGMLTNESGLPGSMEEDLPSVGPTIMPPREDDDDRNAPGTSFLGDQPLVDEPAKAQPGTQSEEGKTLSDIERDVHSSHLDQSVPNQTTAFEPPLAAPSFNSANVPNISVVPPTMPPDEPLDPIVSAFNQPAAPEGEGDTSVPNMPIQTPATTLPGSPSGVDSSLNDARNAVEQAMGAGGGAESLAPIQALNAQPMGSPQQQPPVPQSYDNAAPAAPVQPWTPTPDPVTPDLSFNNAGQPQFAPPAAAPVFSQPAPNGYGLPAVDPNAPPSVPPPMLPPTR
jgi:hypothetical protein